MHMVRNEEGITKEEQNKSPRTEQRSERGSERRGALGRWCTCPVTGLVQSPWQYLCRSSLCRAVARPVRQSRGRPKPTTCPLIPVKEERLSWQPGGHVAKWRARRHGGVMKGCAEPAQD